MEFAVGVAAPPLVSAMRERSACARRGFGVLIEGKDIVFGGLACLSGRKRRVSTYRGRGA